MRHFNFWRFWSNMAVPKSWSKDVKTFLKLVVKSGLVSVGDLDEACADIGNDRTTAIALDDVCVHLTSKGILTTWQCDKLRQGKYKGFFLEGYCRLKEVRKTDKVSIYLAKQVSTGKLVALDITPVNLNPIRDGKIHFTVRDYNEETDPGDA